MSEILEELRQATDSVSDAEANVAHYRSKLADATTALNAARQRRLYLIKAAAAYGDRQPEIAEAAGITQGRVSQILSAS